MSPIVACRSRNPQTADCPVPTKSSTRTTTLTPSSASIRSRREGLSSQSGRKAVRCSSHHVDKTTSASHALVMASPHHSTTLATFKAAIQRSKDRLVAIPAATQRELRLTRRPDNHIIAYSIRPAGEGRWNHHLAKLTSDNEFSIPT